MEFVGFNPYEYLDIPIFAVHLTLPLAGHLSTATIGMVLLVNKCEKPVNFLAKYRGLPGQ
jgi:hypothetical protein